MYEMKVLYEKNANSKSNRGTSEKNVVVIKNVLNIRNDVPIIYFCFLYNTLSQE